MVLFFFIYSVTTVELMIHDNHISEVYSVNSIGQYVALTLGLCGFVGFLYQLLKLSLVSASSQ